VSTADKIVVDKEVVDELLKKYGSILDEAEASLDAFPGTADGGRASSHIAAVAAGAMEIAQLGVVVERALCEVTRDVTARLLADDEEAAQVLAGLDGYEEL
jgi:TRAP-type mannitol/chloroaromatic compound transport system substrate-binding protein